MTMMPRLKNRRVAFGEVGASEFEPRATQVGYEKVRHLLRFIHDWRLSKWPDGGSRPGSVNQ